LVSRDISTLESGIYHGYDIELVRTACKLRNNASKVLVNSLRSSDIAEQQTIADDSRRGVIATGFYS
jgi:hypothetical protein